MTVRSWVDAGSKPRTLESAETRSYQSVVAKLRVFKTGETISLVVKKFVSVKELLRVR